MIIGIVTPSYLRVKFLKRFLRLMPRQTYTDWRLIVVHDGPSLEVKSFVDRAREQDSRIAYAQTQERTNNYGVTPRAEGLRYMIREVGADYCVLWDDDCYFHKNALQQIVNSLEEAGRPDLLLVPMRYRRKLVPNPGASPDQLDWGDLDTGSIILRPKLGLDGYEELLKKDFELFLRQRAVSGFPLVPVYSRRKARHPDPRGVVSTDRRARRTQDRGLHPEPLQHTTTGHREQDLAPGCLESSRFRLTVNTPVIAVVIISGMRPFYQFSFVPSEDRCGCCQ